MKDTIENPYADLMDLPRPVSKKRKHMSRLDRAAQFSPFAALTGYDEVIRERARLTEGMHELCADGITDLDDKLQLLQENISKAPELTVVYFQPDQKKSGGAYVQIQGKLRRLDQSQQYLVLEGDIKIPFRWIYDISGGDL